MLPIRLPEANSGTVTADGLCASPGDAGVDQLEILDVLESGVRSYCRDIPVVFSSARGATLIDRDGRQYIDLLAGAGSLNYGHNDPHIKAALLTYLSRDGIMQSLDLATEAKIAFLRRFAEVILGPRNLPYRCQFTGPTGANSVEAAIKLARKVTGRSSIAAFTGAYHGVSLGALALTGSNGKRMSCNAVLSHVTRLAYDGYYGEQIDTSDLAAKVFRDPSSGVEAPAAFIVEVVQGEGGLNQASDGWLRRLGELARELGSLFIVDDIQAGCGRTGPFFSFETAGIRPDMVCLSKSLGGSGLPFSLLLTMPQWDAAWQPGEHNGTFRGNNLAFVGATAALDYWVNSEFIAGISERTKLLTSALKSLSSCELAGRAVAKGRGLLQGLQFFDPQDAVRYRRFLLNEGVVAETCGPRGEVLKVMPPLNISLVQLESAVECMRLSARRLLLR